MSSGITVTANNSAFPYIAQWDQYDYHYCIGVSTNPLTQYEPMTFVYDRQFTNRPSQGHRLPIRSAGDRVVGSVALCGTMIVFGASLWTLSFLVFAATLNATTLAMHMTDNSNASAWQPIDMYGNQSFVRSIYHAFIAFGQAIGPSSQARLGGYVLQDLLEDYAAICGLPRWHTCYHCPYQLEFNNPPKTNAVLASDLTLDTQVAGRDIYLAYLTNDGANARHVTSFDEISYEESDDGTPTQLNGVQSTVTVGETVHLASTYETAQQRLPTLDHQWGKQGHTQVPVGLLPEPVLTRDQVLRRA